MENKPTQVSESVVENSWQSLKAFTDARIGLGRAGSAIPTKQLLEFQMDHANARDAIHTPLDVAALETELPSNTKVITLASQAVNRAVYLQRPDYGRRLSTASLDALTTYHESCEAPATAAIVVVDGLSSKAIQSHAPNMVARLCDAFEEKNISLGPVCIVEQGRVAIGDEIGEFLGVDILVLLVGERPGLSSPDSLGIYYTFKPKLGLQDAARNCISNIRPAGLSFQEATDKLMWLIDESIKLNQSGVMLKDESEAIDGVSDASSSIFLLP